MKKELLLRLACVLGLVALGLMVWSLFDPRPIPVVVAMSVGQVIGTLSFASFLYVVVSDLRRQIKHAPEAAPAGSARRDAPEQGVE